MPTNRPFLANIFLAFRSHSVIQKPSTSVPTTKSVSNATGRASVSTGTASVCARQQQQVGASNSSPNSPSSSPSPSSALAAAAAASSSSSSQQQQQHHQHQQQQQQQQQSHHHYQQQPRQRRRSSSSSADGLMNALNGEKWWIGGRASDGQAHFYQLQPVRHRSHDRISLDRLSI